MHAVRWLTLGMMACWPLCVLADSGERTPNIVFILADDLGWRDLSNAGSTFYESPSIDRIRHEGMAFSRGYATCQVCSPSRASILTGKYPPRTWHHDLDRRAVRNILAQHEPPRQPFASDLPARARRF